jgi:hypothetical protein
MSDDSAISQWKRPWLTLSKGKIGLVNTNTLLVPRKKRGKQSQKHVFHAGTRSRTWRFKLVQTGHWNAAFFAFVEGSLNKASV